MFDTEDWNDSSDAQHLSKSVHHHWKPSPGVQEEAVTPGTERKLTRKRLLETLRVLEAASHGFQVDKGPLPAQEDDEAQAMETCAKHKKRKNRKRAGSEMPLKKRKPSVEIPKMRAKTHVTELEGSRGTAADVWTGSAEALVGLLHGQADSDSDVFFSIHPPAISTAQDRPEKGMAVTAQTPGEPDHQLSRKKWKNKQKNKKRNKNKFKVTPESKNTKPESTEKRAAGPMKNGSCSPRSDICEASKGSSLQDNITISRKGPKLSPRGRVMKAHLKKILQQKKSTDLSAVNGKGANAAEVSTAGGQSVDPGNTEAAVTQEQTQMCTDRSAALHSRMEERLKAARFRYINQQLYTSSSREAQRLFQQDPEAFQIYHRGFSTQLQRWPKNPTDEIIKYLRNRPASLVVADFGCGDCKIARSVRNMVHSFDLVALNDRVTVCDMAKVPLHDESVDIAVFCLALMGTNLREFFEEANRVLKPGGILKVAEVASRFEDIRPFISAVANLGFKNISKDTSDSFFYMFDFLKTGPPRSKGKVPGLQLKACLYKKR